MVLTVDRETRPIPQILIPSLALRMETTVWFVPASPWKRANNGGCHANRIDSASCVGMDQAPGIVYAVSDCGWWLGRALCPEDLVVVSLLLRKLWATGRQWKLSLATTGSSALSQVPLRGYPELP